MELATWILVVFLSIMLFIFLCLGIVLLVKLIGVTKEVNKIVMQGQTIAEKTDDIVGNFRDMTTVGGLVKKFVTTYTEAEEDAKKGKRKK